MNCDVVGPAKGIAIGDKPADTHHHRLRLASSVAVRTGLWVFAALWFFGCVNQPYDGQEVPNSWDPIAVTGAYTDPGVGIRVEAYDFNDYNWWLADLFISTDGLRLNQLGYPADLNWGVFYRGVTLPNRFGVWQRQVGTNGDTLPHHRARIRVTADAGSYPGPLLVLPQGYGDCTKGYSSITAALAGCGSFGSQRFADIHTPGYSEANYANRSVVVARHSSLALNNEKADAFLYDASVIVQREDPNANGQSSGDYACPVNFVRSGNVRTVSNCPAVIDSLADWQCYTSINFGERSVVQVEDIKYCNGSTNSGIFGCTDVNNRMAIVDRGGPSAQAATLWAHELMHSFGWRGHLGNYNVLGLDLNTSRRLDSEQCEDLQTRF